MNGPLERAVAWHFRDKALGVLALMVIFAWLPAPARAHDIPNERVDRAIQVTFDEQGLKIDYEVSLADLTLVQDLKRLAGHVADTEREALYRTYAQVVGPLNAKGFLASVDGRELMLAYDGFTVAVEEHPRFLFHLSAPLPPSGRLRIVDTNYVSSEGTSKLACRARPHKRLLAYDGPLDVNEVDARPVWMLSDAEERATKELAVDFETSPEMSETAVDASSRSTERPRGRLPSEPGLSSLLQKGGPLTWAALWLVAFGLGAAHSLQPGHGKTLVAAGSLGSRLGWKGGLVLAIATTLAHFSSVLLIAALLWLTPQAPYRSIQAQLTLAAAALVGVLGFWRIGRCFSDRPQRAPQSNEVSARSTASFAALCALGISGGIIPCWDAVLLLVLAALGGVLAQGLVLLTGFSLGMATVLAAVGTVAGRFRAAFESKPSFQSWARGLNLASGAVLASFACYLLARSF